MCHMPCVMCHAWTNMAAPTCSADRLGRRGPIMQYTDRRQVKRSNLGSRPKNKTTPVGRLNDH